MAWPGAGAAVGGTQRAPGWPISADCDLLGGAVMGKLQADVCQRVGKSVLRATARLLQTESAGK